MLARHGWRKIAPDTTHPKGDLLVREDWKKLPGVLDQTITEFAMPRPVRPLVKQGNRAKRGLKTETR